MSRTVTLHLEDALYQKMKIHAEDENRPLSNYIETATRKYMEIMEYADDFEMETILKDEGLMASLKKGSADAKRGKGRFL